MTSGVGTSAAEVPSSTMVTETTRRLLVLLALVLMSMLMRARHPNADRASRQAGARWSPSPTPWGRPHPVPPTMPLQPPLSSPRPHHVRQASAPGLLLAAATAAA